jgi:hypothetical protein
MAQETAGTLSKTILKNELLPSLENYARKQERLEKLKAAQEAKAADLAAKKAAEDAKFRADIGSTEGGFIMPQIQQLNKADIDKTVAIFSDPNSTPQQKYQAQSDLNRLISERNAYQKYNESGLEGQVKTLEPYYNVSKADIANYGRKVAADPSLFGINHATEFGKFVRQDPNRVKWRDVGNSLFKTVGSDKFSFTNSAGQQEVIDASRLFIPEQVTNPVTGRKITANRINGQIASEVAMGDPEVRGIVTNYVDLRMPELAKDEKVKQAANAKGVELNDYVADVATTEALNKLFANMGGVTYSQDLQTVEGKAKGAARGQKLAEITMTNEPSVSQAYAGRGPALPNRPKGAILYEEIAWGNVPTFTIPKTSIPGGANKRVTPLSNPEEFKEIFAPAPGGGYLLKQGFDVDSGQLVNASEAKEDIPLKNGGVKKKGSILSPRFIRTMSPEQQKKYVKTYEAYKVTPQIMSYKYDEENETYDMKTPQVKTVEMLIPKDYAGELTSALKSKNEGVNVGKPGRARISNYSVK